MKLHLYKVFDLTDINDSGESPMDCCQVMTDKDLRREFLWAYDKGRIPHDLIDDYKTDPDYKAENWNDMGNLRIGTMVDMLNDITNYVCGEGYYILETDVDIEPSIKDKELAGKLSSWLDVLNYWDSDVADCAERINKMGMYKEYEVAEDEIYNLWKKLTEAK